MASKDSFLDIPWDPKSEQPFRIRHHRGLLTRIRYSLPEYIKCGFLTLGLAPAIAVRHWSIARGAVPRGWRTRTENVRDFMGLAVALHSCPPDRLAAEIRELGVKHLLLRIPVWEVDQLEKYQNFLRSVPDCEVTVAIMQNRRNVLEPSLWRGNLFRIVGSCWPRVKAFQIGQGSNRSKWGCFSIGEFLAMASEAEKLRPEFPGIELVGPGALDFEPLALMRGVSHWYPIRWDVAGCALYVDRRGSPRTPQMKFFDFKHKIYNAVACVAGWSRAKPRLWITEVNWPLKGQGRWAPTSGSQSVTEEQGARYLQEYFEDAWRTRLVERVYWWQLVAKGYGLIDVDGAGTLRRRPAYDTFRHLLDNGIDGEGVPPAETVSSNSQEGLELQETAADRSG